MHCAISKRTSSARWQRYYKVGEEAFYDLGVKESIVRGALESAGCCDIITRILDKETAGIPDDAATPAFKGFMFVSAKRRVV